MRLLRGAQCSRQLASALKSLGVFYRNEGQFDKAFENLDEARNISATTGDQANVKQTRTDHTPKVGDPRALHLWSRLSIELGKVEDMLIGLERQVTGYFYAGSTSPEPSRGSLHSFAEHQQIAAARQRRTARGEYTPTPLIDQPRHPGAQR